jgi:Putative transposase/Transposase zinc-binding domain
MTRPAFEVAGIFRAHGARYRQQHALPFHQLRLMQAIESCRTAALGGNREKCGYCAEERNSYNSCCNRHCPKCQNRARRKWVESRKGELLPVDYHHVVFTIPEQLNDLVLRNKPQLYKILFAASAATLQTIAADPRHLGAHVGFFSVLHSWGQNLLFHPHIHCIATGGGISLDGTRWISSKPGFFLPVRVLSRLFRRLFLEALEDAFRENLLCFPGKIAVLRKCAAFFKLTAALRRIEWVVYSKPPFGGPHRVVEYLGRYTHRVAIDNRRILNVRDGKVTFQYKQYRSANAHKSRTMTVDADEFIRRLLLHSLPPGLPRIRHYGLLAGRTKKSNLVRCRELLQIPAESLLPMAPQIQALLSPILETSRRCPVCLIGLMIRIARIAPIPQNSS